ncbi:MAG: ChaN family lipoprotein, partial [Bacteroidota bacterium]
MQFGTHTIVLIAQSTFYKIYSSASKQEITLEELIEATSDTEVLVFGEQHDDSIAHDLQDKIYAMLLDKYTTVALSMEMFETDGQLILDEYLAG